MTEQSAVETTIADSIVESWRTGFRGALIGPEDPAYDPARAVFNGMIDRRPALIARPSGPADVMHAVNVARENGLLLAVRGGGHNVAGNAVCDGGLVIDLSAMKGVRVDPTARRVWAQGGLVWNELDHETQPFGLATTGGLVSTTGIAGFTLGGGIGWLQRKYGLACDNLVSVDIVTADGQLRTASADQNEDLFWAVRGGGGNFGVVTSFEYELHPVGPIVLGGLLMYPFERARDVLRFYRDFVREQPDEFNTVCVIVTAPPAPFVPAELQGKIVVGIAVCWCGDLEEGQGAVAPLKEFGPPAVDLVGPLPYTALQSMLDETAPPGMNNYWKSAYLGDLSDEAIDTILAYAPSMTPPLSGVHLHQMGGAVARLKDTAFVHRDAAFTFNAVGTWPDPADNDRSVQWVRTFWDAMQPFASGVYVNFLADEGQDLIRASYDQATYDRLAEVKGRYDPTNLFRMNQNIRPPQRAT